jgi:hypothetical protein
MWAPASDSCAIPTAALRRLASKCQDFRRSVEDRITHYSLLWGRSIRSAVRFGGLGAQNLHGTSDMWNVASSENATFLSSLIQTYEGNKIKMSVSISISNVLLNDAPKTIALIFVTFLLLFCLIAINKYLKYVHSFMKIAYFINLENFLRM